MDRRGLAVVDGGAGMSLEERAAEDRSVPDDIQKVEDARPYVRACFAALLDKSNYDAQVDVKGGELTGAVDGFKDMCAVAQKTLEGMGFGEYAARWSVHGFHWMMTGTRTVKYVSSYSPGGEISGAWTLDEESINPKTTDELTDAFMEGYVNKRGVKEEPLAINFLAKLQSMRERS